MQPNCTIIENFFIAFKCCVTKEFLLKCIYFSTIWYIFQNVIVIKIDLNSNFNSDCLTFIDPMFLVFSCLKRLSLIEATLDTTFIFFPEMFF